MVRLRQAMRRAARIDKPQPAIVKALREYGCKVAHTHTVGDGFPDLVISIHGRLGLVECKDGSKPPSKRALTEEQVRFWYEWEGTPMALVTDVEGALRFARVLAFEVQS